MEETEIDNWRHGQRRRERGSVDLGRMSVLFLLVMSTSQEEASDRKRHILCLLISELIEATLISTHFTQQSGERQKAEKDPKNLKVLLFKC